MSRTVESDPAGRTRATQTFTRSRRWVGRYPVASLLAAIVLSYIVTSFEGLFVWSDLLESVVLSAVLLAGLRVVGGRGGTLAIAIVLLLPAILGKWVDHWRPGLVPPELYRGSSLLFVAFVVYHLFRFILRGKRIDSEVVCAGVAIYLLLGLIWAFAYMLVGQWVPGSFEDGTGSGRPVTGFAAVYFSFITLCTVGYGDIVPKSGPARMLAMMEAVTGTFYMAVLVARLVSLYSSAASDPGTGAPGQSTLPEPGPSDRQ